MRLAALGAAVLVGSAGSAPTQAAQVSMPAKLFAPRDLEVLLGTTVTWRNADSTTHTVTEDEDEFDSGFVRPGGTFAQTFTEQGVFVYGCSIHRFMRGSVRVFQVVLSGPEEPLPAGRRARLEGLAPPGTTEVVLERVSPGPRAFVARATPGADGVFGFTVRAPEPRSYRVRAGSASSPIVRMRGNAARAIARRGAAIVVSARPARAGSRVAIQVYERELFAFVTVARGRLEASSRAAIPYVPERRVHVRAVVRGARAGATASAARCVVRPALIV